MEYKRQNDKIAVRLDKGEDINEQLRIIAENEKITFAQVSGIGATDDFTAGVFDLGKQTYEKFHFTGNHEITNLCGNINTLNGEPYVHLHITCADKSGKTVGGHLLNSRISLTAEIMIILSDMQIDRKHDEELNINRLSF